LANRRGQNCIVEGSPRRIVFRRRAASLKDKAVISLDLGSMLAGANTAASLKIA